MNNQKKEILNILTFKDYEASPNAMENFNGIVERASPINGEENFDDDDYQVQPRNKSSPPGSERKSRSVTKITINSNIKSNSIAREPEGFFGKI